MSVSMADMTCAVEGKAVDAPKALRVMSPVLVHIDTLETLMCSCCHTTYTHFTPIYIYHWSIIFINGEYYGYWSSYEMAWKWLYLSIISKLNF